MPSKWDMSSQTIQEIHNLTISKLGNHEILCHFDVILIIIYEIYYKERTNSDFFTRLGHDAFQVNVDCP